MSFEKVRESLEKKGFKVSCFSAKEEAAEYICSNIEGKKIGFGGSVTLDEMGLYEKLSRRMR